MRQMATMIEAGIPISRCLNVLGSQSSGGLARAAARMKMRIDGGSNLTDAAREHPGIFSPVDLNLLQAGETSGKLGPILLKMADTHESRNRMKKQFVSRLIYPVLLLHAGVVIPAGVTWFQKSADAAVEQILGVLIPIYLVAAFLYAIYRWGGRLGARRVLDTIIYYTPVVGRVVHKLGVARFALTFEALYGSGINVFEVVPIAAAATGNTVMEEKIMRAMPALQAGQDLATAFISTGAFSPVVNAMIATGAEAGKLDAMLSKVKETAEYEAEMSLAMMSKVIPGIIYGLVALLMIKQIFMMAQSYSSGIDSAIKGRF